MKTENRSNEEMKTGNLDYGVIGNCRSAALISKYGTIEWCCLPDFNSASLFARILDREKGGAFGIDVSDDYTISQSYEPRTNILVTRFESDEGCFEICDFMPRYQTNDGNYHIPPDLIRYVRHVWGIPKFATDYDPRPGYAESDPQVKISKNYIKCSTTSGVYESIYLYSSFSLQKIINKEEIEITGDGYFLVSYNQKILSLNLDVIYLQYRRTEVYWLEWVQRTKVYEHYKHAVIRSALVLKLLTYQPSGAIIAAVTTSLPETIGEVRNWDYRFCWIRDASMIISTLTSLGHQNSAQRFLTFILGLIPFKDDKIQIMYGIRGEKNLTERELSWLSGYEGSSPVRVGNAAYMQKQNDIYGVLIDVIYKYFGQFETDIYNGEELWTIARSLINTVVRHWKEKDMSIWEFRTQQQHFVFSKVLCWVALDRGVKLADLFAQTKIRDNWLVIRDEIKADILKQGWNSKVEAFTQYYGSDDLDAANLLMADYGFIDHKDIRYIKTVLKTKENLLKNGLMFRYRNRDDFGEPSSSFTVCTFWLIKSLYLIGEEDQAVKLFDQLLSYKNHLGLYSEDIDFTSKRLLGNFPQGYSHLALIDTAITLSDRTLLKETEIYSYITETHEEDGLYGEDIDCFEPSAGSDK